jgi:hypothetical protein
VQTFIVRIAPAEHPDEAWHGIVQRIADGSEQPFHGVDQLLDAMRPDGATSGDADDPVRRRTEQKHAE